MPATRLAESEERERCDELEQRARDRQRAAAPSRAGIIVLLLISPAAIHKLLVLVRSICSGSRRDRWEGR
jgi:hypothetical protein